MNITKITVGRLYNLGSYEHVRYELTVEIPQGESANTAIRGIEKILAGLAPIKSQLTSSAQFKHREDEIERMMKMPVAEWQQNYGHCRGTPSEVIARYRESLDKDIAENNALIERAKTARKLFDDLNGAAVWKDAKLDWEDDDQ